MPKFPKRACSICGTIFQPRSEIHEYCSGGCRTEGHRKRHAMEEPSFLRNAKSPKETTLKIVGNTSSHSPEKLKAIAETKPDFTDIGLTEYIPNPAYVRAAKKYEVCLDNTAKLEKKRQELLSEINTLNGKNTQETGIILGGLAGVGLGFSTIYLKAKNTNKLWYLLLIPAGIIGMIVGGSLAIKSYFSTDKTKELEQLNTKEEELSKLDAHIEQSKLQQKEAKIERDAVQKQIPKYGKVSIETIYDDFEDVSKQKAISLESLKNKKFKTLAFSDKWKDLVGTPEANFCMMVYGNPGQGKSYFTLELSEYLAHHFGTVLFNSSEEGFSLSLQNKIADLNMENIFLGNVNNINSLQLLLVQSPYKFVVIDSVNHMNITPEDLRKLRGLHPTKGFICILQSTKGGDFKGSNEYEHDADISIKVEKRKPECVKTRYK